ncbi:MAG TPA: DinB family protein [Cyclobacteriaceae bacterium]|nr:DinB family protein [Cyclobacteriaceae bacterium]
MSYSVITHIRYNYWACARIVDLLKTLDEKFIFTQLKSSFPGIGKTLLHIWDGEVVWLKRLQGESMTDLPSKDFKGKKDELLTGAFTSSQVLLGFVESKGNDFFASKISYRNIKGDPYENIAEDILFHIVNHGTYHRGQIITMLRELEIVQVPNTDLVNFLRSNK